MKGEPLLSPAEDGLNELTLSNAAYLSSWEGGRPVALPLDEARFDELLAQRQAESKVLGAGQGITHDITGEYSHRWQTNW